MSKGKIEVATKLKEKDEDQEYETEKSSNSPWRKASMLCSCIVAYIIIVAYLSSWYSWNDQVENDSESISATFDLRIPGNYEPHIDAFYYPYGPGERGEAHELDEDQKNDEEYFKGVYGFNQMVSDEISVNRTIPDLRDDECQYWNYPETLPSTSVIIIFHNEGWSTLLRTVNSVLLRTPPQLLEEIVLVDDRSELSHLWLELEMELDKPFYVDKVRLHRNGAREGLIRSKNIGAQLAKGKVIVFMDSHCEVGYNWLPPLLEPIGRDRKTISVPIVDIIDWNDFSIRSTYPKDEHYRGQFEWGLLYKEGKVPDSILEQRIRPSEPYPSPTHAGGLFAVRKDWFMELGAYDAGLFIWGGENFELSFKLWMCGGRSVWVPCSRIAHVYRGHSCSACHFGEYSDRLKNVPLHLRNYRRVVETWFDEKYKEYFYTREPLAKFLDFGDISEQLEIKKRLQCESFDWFMNEIAFDILKKYPVPPPNRFWGQIRNLGYIDHICLEQAVSAPVFVNFCNATTGNETNFNQMFKLNTAGQLTSGEHCIDLDDQHVPRPSLCPFGSAAGPWVHNINEQLEHKDSGMCLTADPHNGHIIVMAICNAASPFQKWSWEKITPIWAKDEEEPKEA